MMHIFPTVDLVPRRPCCEAAVAAIFGWIDSASSDASLRYIRHRLGAPYRIVFVDQALQKKWSVVREELAPKTSNHFPVSLSHRLHGAGIFTNIGPKNHLNVGRYTIHGAYGSGKHLHNHGKSSKCFCNLQQI